MDTSEMTFTVLRFGLVADAVLAAEQERQANEIGDLYTRKAALAASTSPRRLYTYQPLVELQATLQRLNATAGVLDIIGELRGLAGDWQASAAYRMALAWLPGLKDLSNGLEYSTADGLTTQDIWTMASDAATLAARLTEETK